MKINITMLLLLLTLIGNTQNLQYNRTIDTILTITIPNGTIFTTSNHVIVGSFLTPPNNKVWKVQSIMINAPCDECQNNGNSTLHYNSGNSYGNLTSVSGGIAVLLRNNSDIISMYRRTIPSSLAHEHGNNFLSSPLWLNASELGIGFNHTYSGNNDPYLILDYIGKIHLSILEFSTD